MTTDLKYYTIQDEQFLKKYNLQCTCKRDINIINKNIWEEIKQLCMSFQDSRYADLSAQFGEGRTILYCICDETETTYAQRMVPYKCSVLLITKFDLYDPEVITCWSVNLLTSDYLLYTNNLKIFDKFDSFCEEARRWLHLGSHQRAIFPENFPNYEKILARRNQLKCQLI